MKVFEHGELPLFHEDASGEFGIIVKTKLSANRTIEEVVVKRYPSKAPFNEVQVELDKLDGVDHPNLLRVHGLVHFEEEVGLLVQPAHGLRLSDVLYQHQSASMCRRLQWIRGIIDGMQALHDAQLVHGNLTPNSVIFPSETAVEPLITDYGMTRFYARYIPGWELDRRYAAPEVTSAETCSARTDIYSLGLLLWQIVTLQRLPECKLPCLRYVSNPRQAAILALCWSKCPVKRPELSEIAEAFETC